MYSLCLKSLAYKGKCYRPYALIFSFLGLDVSCLFSQSIHVHSLQIGNVRFKNYWNYKIFRTSMNVYESLVKIPDRLLGVILNALSW